MSSTSPAGRPGSQVIVDWTVLSPFGVGREAFRDGLAAGLPVHAESVEVPGTRACRVPDFSAREALGKKGTRSMDRLTAMTVATVGQLVTRPQADAPLDGGTQRAHSRALVLGTTTGSAQSMMDFTRDTLTQDKPYHVDPARFPNTVMNCAAGQAAIWYQLRGPNATIGGGRAAGLLALNYARRLAAAERADTVLCGGAEEYSTARGWLRHHARDIDGREVVLGEGCAMLLLKTAEEAGDTGLAEVTALEFGVFATGADAAEVLADCVRAALDSVGLTPADIWVVAGGDFPDALGDQERAALDDVFADHAVRRVACAQVIGDTDAAAATFRIASVLATAMSEPCAIARHALVTSVDAAGVVGCAVLSLRASADVE